MNSTGQSRKKFEIAAPAGDARSMAAAVLAGADAVYFGMRQFNARIRAANFDEREILQAITFLRRQGVRSYITLNTLIREEELDALEQSMRLLRRCPPDAIIFQDLAVLEMARVLLPGTDLHASTQFGVCETGGLRVLEKLGVKRVVLARELNRAELAALAAASPVELEVFIFGALCYSVSGYCYASRLATGRSGNRGECAQLCRARHGSGCPFSLKDLDLVEQVDELTELGIRIFKIEGRLKGASYVHDAVGALRLLRDGVRSPKLLEEVRQRTGAILTRPRGQGYFNWPEVDLFTGSQTGIQVVVAAVRKAQDWELAVDWMPGGNLLPGDRIKIRGAGAVVTERQGDRLILSTPLTARPGDRVERHPNPDRVPGISRLVDEIGRTGACRPVRLRVMAAPDQLRAEVYTEDGIRLGAPSVPASTAVSTGDGVTAGFLMEKLAGPSIAIAGLEVNENRLVIRHADVKLLKKAIIETAWPEGSEPGPELVEAEPLDYGEPPPAAAVLPPAAYRPAALPPADAVVINNPGQAAGLADFPGAAWAGRFLPVLNRRAAAVWRRLGIAGFSEPHELKPGTGTPSFVTRVPPRELPAGYTMSRQGDVWLIFGPGQETPAGSQEKLPFVRENQPQNHRKK